MRVVTTCNAEGFKQYGHRVLDTWSNWPRNAELYFYADGFDFPETGGVISRPMPQGLANFKERYGDYEPPSYLYDVVRFSHKVYAATDALRDYRGIGVWLDADCVTYKSIPAGFIESQLPKGCYLSLFQRKGAYTETGFWIMDCSHHQHEEFVATWEDWYNSGAFKGLSNWTDCETLDATVRKMEREGLIKVHNLSSNIKSMHPISEHEIGQYIDHCKGARKIAGFSPENKSRIGNEPYQLNDTK